MESPGVRNTYLYKFPAAILFLAFLTGVCINLFCIYLNPESVICTCNHGSSREKHMHSDRTASNKGKGMVHCEDASPGERHFCSCKKHHGQSQTTSFLVILAHPMGQRFLFPPKFNDILSEEESGLLSGIHYSIWHPPKV